MSCSCALGPSVDRSPRNSETAVPEEFKGSLQRAVRVAVDASGNRWSQDLAVERWSSLFLVYEYEI